MTRERRKYYAPLLQLFVILIWCVSAAHAHHGGGYHYSHSACANNPDWMAGLANNLRISDLSIPGTHDTYSIVEHSWAAHCQMMGLTAQLTSGIRVLDVRLNVEGNRLRTAHGSYEFSSYFEHVLAGCTEFLGAHDQETILMRVQRNSGDVALFAELFEDYIHAPYEDTTYFGRWFWNPVTSTNPHNPTLGEVRGKIVLLQNFSVYPDTLYGLQYGDASMDIQDSFKMSTNWSLSQWKAQAVVDHLAKAANGTPETIYINYLVGSFGAFPYFVASGHSSPGTNDPHLWMGWCFGGCGHLMWTRSFLKCCFFMGTNEVAYRYLLNNRHRAGLVMADFPGPGLINTLINLNYELFPNSPPFAASGSAYEGFEGGEIVFDGSDSSDPDGDAILFRWDVDGDGAWDTEWSEDPTATRVWRDNACTHDPDSMPPAHQDTVCVAVLEVRDAEHVSSDAALVIISNVAPRATIEEIVSPVAGCILPGQLVTFDALFSDPGCLDTLMAAWDFGDGTAVPGSITSEIACPDTTGTVSDIHRFGRPGLFPVVLEVQDNDRGAGSDTVLVRIMTALEAMDYVNAVIQGLPEACFRGQASQRKNALSNKLMEVQGLIDAGDVEEAIEKLRNDIRAKADGWLGGHAANDWIIAKEAQVELCLLLDELINYLQSPTDESHGEELVRRPNERTPARWVLPQNEPNPFNPTTTIKFALQQAVVYRLTIFDVSGRTVRCYSASGGPGEVSIVWDGRTDAGVAVSSGIYFYRLDAADFTDTRKMILLR